MLKKIRSHLPYLMAQFVEAFGVCAIAVTILVATPYFSNELSSYALYFYGAVFAGSLIWALMRLWSRISSVAFDIRGSQLSVAIVFEDILKQQGSIIVPVSPRFRHRLKSSPDGVVSPHSIHGQLISEFDDETAFLDAVTEALKDVPSSNTGKLSDETAEYPFGTVASIKRPNSEGQPDSFWHLVAVTKEDVEAGKTYTNLPILVPSLSRALEHITALDASRGRDETDVLFIPLIGTGYGRIRLEKENLLDVLIAMVVEHFDDIPREQNVTFALEKKLRGSLKIYNIKREWT